MPRSEIDILMQSLRDPIRQAMRTDPSLMHRAYMLEARIALAEIRGKQDELAILIDEYSTLSKETAELTKRSGQ